MNKRIKKKRRLEIKLAQCLAREHVIMQAVTEQNDRIQALETANHLQHEHIEDLGNQVAELKRLVKQNAEATNNRLDDQDGKIKKIADDLAIKTAKRSFFGRK